MQSMLPLGLVNDTAPADAAAKKAAPVKKK